MSKKQYLARIEKLKANIVGKLTIFKLADGRRYSFKKDDVLAACSNAVFGEGDETETFVLKNAIEASDKSKLHELLQMVLGE
jgi:hypothetical protein